MGCMGLGGRLGPPLSTLKWRQHVPLKLGIQRNDYMVQQPRLPLSKLTVLWKPQILNVRIVLLYSYFS